MAQPVDINKISTYLYVKHESFKTKDLALDLSASGDQLKVLRNTWVNYFVLMFKNLISFGGRNETILRLATDAFQIKDCTSLKDLQSRQLSADDLPEITEQVAQKFADMLYNGPRDDYARGTSDLTDSTGSYEIKFKLFKHPLVDVKLIPMESLKGITMPTLFAEKLKPILDGSIGRTRFSTQTDQFGEVAITIKR